MFVFRQLFDTASSTYTYLLADAGEALLIDPVFEHAPRDAALLRELGFGLVATLDTHVHADHVTGAWRLKQATGSRILVGADTGAHGADRLLAHGDEVRFGSRRLAVRATPGHTSGCLSFVLDDDSLAFTGDALLIRGCGRTDFQQGSARRLFESVQRQLLSLPPHCLLYPAHDYRGLTVTSVAEERRYNPRLGGEASVEDFEGYMGQLGLPHPRQMAVAVPANLRCGEPEDPSALPEPPGWAPLRLSFGGLWEIEPAVLAERLANAPLQLVDVREPHEFDDVLGHVPGARLLPLAELAARSGELDRGTPLVAICRSGTRSSQAITLL